MATNHHGEIYQAELNCMRDPIARMLWEKWIAEGSATLIEEEKV